MDNVAAQSGNDNVQVVGNLSQSLVRPNGLTGLAVPVLDVTGEVATGLNSLYMNQIVLVLGLFGLSGRSGGLSGRSGGLGISSGNSDLTGNDIESDIELGVAVDILNVDGNSHITGSLIQNLEHNLEQGAVLLVVASANEVDSSVLVHAVQLAQDEVDNIVFSLFVEEDLDQFQSSCVVSDAQSAVGDARVIHDGNIQGDIFADSGGSAADNDLGLGFLCRNSRNQHSCHHSDDNQDANDFLHVWILLFHLLIYD